MIRKILLFVTLLITFAVCTRTAWDHFLERIGCGDWRLIVLPPSSNDMSNYDTIQALVERSTWRINESMFETADKVHFRESYYSVRPPVLPFLTSFLYAILLHFGSLRFSTHPNLVTWILTVSVCGALSSIACVCVANCLQTFNARVVDSRLCAFHPTIGALSLGLASLMLPYSVVFNHHIVAASLDMFAIGILVGCQLRNECSKPSLFFVGLFSGLAATIDLAGGGIFLFAILGWIISYPLFRSRILAALFGVALMALFHFSLNFAITGDLRPLLLRKDLIEGSSPWLRSDELSGFMNHKNLRAFGDYIFGMLIGYAPSPRGLFLYSPCVMFGWLAGWRIARTANHPLRGTAVWLLIGSVALVSYLCIFTNNYSGTNYGIRWYVLLLAPAYLLMFAGWNLLTIWQQLIAIACQIWSMLIAWTGVFRFTWQDWDVFPFLSEIRWVVLGAMLLSLVMPAAEAKHD